MSVTREIHLDTEADRILASISEFYGGDADQALSELLKTRESLGEMLSEIEVANHDELVRQRDRSERQFKSGDIVVWDEVKRRKGL
jgi:hypothetical protein